MSDDMGDILPIARTSRKGMTSNIYKHVPLINMFKAYTNKKNLLRPAKNWFDHIINFAKDSTVEEIENHVHF